MALTPPFTTEDYLESASRVFQLPMNAVQSRVRPRASSLGACARQQGYMMAGAVHDEIGVEGSARATDQDLTAEQGRMFEDLSVRIIEGMGIRVVHRQIELPEDYPVSGHPDGALAFFQRTNDMYDNNYLVETGPDGLVWGFEHKHLGRWSYEATVKRGLFAAEPGYVLQSALYGDALGWDAALFVIVSQDSSSVRGDMTANLRAKNPETRWATDPKVHPKVTIVPIDLRPVKNGLVPMALERAKWLSKWKETSGEPSEIAREYDPEAMTSKWVPDGEGGRMEVLRPGFPCSYCPFLTACLKAGQSGDVAPGLPWVVAEDTGD